MDRAAAAGPRGVDLVAETFLSGPPARPRSAARIVAAAPGDADTAEVLELLCPDAAPGNARDLGSSLAARLGRLEGTRPRDAAEAGTAMLLWCLRGQEGLALTTALVLGRLGALIRPARATLLWFAGAGPCPGREPTAAQREQVRRLATAALPGVPLRLHCLGWREDPRCALADLAGRFR